MNYLLLQSLERFHHFYGNSLKVPLPAGTAFLNAFLRKNSMHIHKKGTLKKIIPRDDLIWFRFNTVTHAHAHTHVRMHGRHFFCL